MDKMLTAKDVAGCMACCENTARAMMKQMPHVVLPGGKAHKAVRVRECDFRVWLMQNTVDPQSPAQGRKKAPTLRMFTGEGLDERGRIPRRKV